MTVSLSPMPELEEEEGLRLHLLEICYLYDTDKLNQGSLSDK